MPASALSLRAETRDPNLGSIICGDVLAKSLAGKALSVFDSVGSSGWLLMMRLKGICNVEQWTCELYAYVNG